jgi:hypothetical protein
MTAVGMNKTTMDIPRASWDAQEQALTTLPYNVVFVVIIVVVVDDDSLHLINFTKIFVFEFN